MDKGITMQEKTKVTEDDNNERGNNVPSPGPNSHSEDRSEAVGNLDLMNVALRSEGQVDTRKSDGASSDGLEDPNWKITFGNCAYTHHIHVIKGLAINFAKTLLENFDDSGVQDLTYANFAQQH